jgi:hypothetical protein
MGQRPLPCLLLKPGRLPPLSLVGILRDLLPLFGLSTV